MNRLGGVILVLGLGLPAVAAGHEVPGQPATPTEQYKALLKEQQAASSSGRALSDEERMAFIGKTFKRRNELALRFVELAEKYPERPDRPRRIDSGGLAG
jgi:hypothetical protein